MVIAVGPLTVGADAVVTGIVVMSAVSLARGEDEVEGAEVESAADYYSLRSGVIYYGAAG